MGGKTPFFGVRAGKKKVFFALHIYVPVRKFPFSYRSTRGFFLTGPRWWPPSPRSKQRHPWFEASFSYQWVEKHLLLACAQVRKRCFSHFIYMSRYENSRFRTIFSGKIGSKGVYDDRTKAHVPSLGSSWWFCSTRMLYAKEPVPLVPMPLPLVPMPLSFILIRQLFRRTVCNRLPWFDCFYLLATSLSCW